MRRELSIDKRPFLRLPARARKRAMVFAVVVLLATWMSDTRRWALRASEDLVVVVELRDFASLGKETCRLARKEVDRIFGDAGIRIEWTDRSKPPRDKHEVTRIYVTRKLPAQLIRRRRSLLGVAIPSTARYRYVYVGKAEVEAVLGASPGTAPPIRRLFSRALGRVIAHELAHHLVATSEHSPSGLLKAAMTYRDLTEKAPAGLYLDEAQIARAHAMGRRFSVATKSEPADRLKNQ